MKKRIDWHSGFAGGLSYGFQKYLDALSIEREHPLTKQPPRIDFIVIKKQADAVIDNAIGRYFRKYNLFEYKSPNDSLNQDVVWKTVGYAGLYKSLTGKTDEISTNEMTITILRSRFPRKLFKQWRDEEKRICKPEPGIYRIHGVVDIPLYIVVTRELTDDDFLPFRIMMKDADPQDIRQFTMNANHQTDAALRYDLRAVLRISEAENRTVFQSLKEEEKMRDGIRELFAEEFAEEWRKGADKEQHDRIVTMLRKGKTPGEIADFCDYPLSLVTEIQESLLAEAF